MKDRAVVLEIRGRRATVLLPGGAFKTIKANPSTLAVGQEVWLPSPRVRRWWQAGAVMASSLALVLVGLADVMAPAAPLAVAVVSVDINPSINLIVGAHQKVIAAVGLDRAGRQILTQYHPVRSSVGLAVEEVTKWAVKDGYVRKGTPTLLIGGAFSGPIPPWFPRLANNETKIVSKNHWPLEVVRVTTRSARLVTSMGHSPISVGRYLLWQHDRHQGRRWTQALAQTVPLTQLVSNAPIVQKGSQTISSGVSTTSTPVILPSIPSANIGLSIPPITSLPGGKSAKAGHPKHKPHHKSHHSHGQTSKSTPNGATPSSPVISGSVPPSTIPSLSSQGSGKPSSLESSLTSITSGLPGL